MEKIRILADAIEMGELNYPLDYMAIELTKDAFQKIKKMAYLVQVHNGDIKAIVLKAKYPSLEDVDESPEWATVDTLFDRAITFDKIQVKGANYVVHPNSFQIHCVIGLDDGIVLSNHIDIDALTKAFKGKDVVLDLRQNS